MRQKLAGPSAAFALLLALGGCQKILGFEELEPASASSAEAGAPSGGSATDPGSGGSSTATGTSGVACDDTSACAQELVCLYGFCRKECRDDTDCAQDSVCLFHGTSGGCRLASETCDQGSCQNADLICGLDATCRIACGKDDSCDATTQRCIAGTCVSTVGENASSWDCGAGIVDGQVTCNASTLSVCNVTTPGLSPIQDCGSAALCEQSLPADPTYDAAAPPSCAGGCSATTSYCAGSKLLICKDDGSGPVGAGEDCLTKELCAATAKAGAKKCLAPVCAANEVHCSGGQTELSVQRCATGRDKFDTLDYCEKATAQCNPGASACLSLSVDATEVTVHDYKTWLAAAPTTAGQPAACADNTSFTPDAACQAKPGASTCADCSQPVVCVDWCDARAYCAAKGQHLCGKLGGGMNPFDRYADAGSSEWMNACSAGGQFDWGSGAAPTMGTTQCNYSGSGLDTSYAVGAHAKCASPSPGYAKIFDLSGNVSEWEDSCQKDATSGSAADACRTRGGSWSTSRDETRCDAAPGIAFARLAHEPSLGFRCCGG